MKTQSPGFEADLRASPLLVLVILVLCGCVGFVFSIFQDDVVEQAAQAVAAVVVLVLSINAWLLNQSRPVFSRWLTILALGSAVVAASLWVGVTASLLMASIPVALAAALIGLRAAGGVAVGATILLLLSPRFTGTGIAPGIRGASLALVWSTFLVMCFAYIPIYRLARWAWDFYQQALQSLEEGRSLKQDLAQTLESLTHANRQLALTNERISALRAVAEEAQKAKTSFVAKVSHELRTPLNMITGLIDIMIEAPELYAVVLSPKMREDLEIIHRNCEYLSDMISDVLDLTGVETGRMVLYRERIDLREIVDRVTLAVSPLLGRKQLNLQIDVPAGLPQVYCDRVRIQQVVLNLLSNAARFTEKGGITIKACQQDEQVLVSVIDTGPGILPQDVERIFEPFSQGTGELWRDKGGSGLGLSISQKFVRLHGGKMWLDSQLGVGSAFHFTLPISPSIAHIARAGHRLIEDWSWRERALDMAQGRCTDEMTKPRVILCDETGSLHLEFARWSDEFEFVTVSDLGQVRQNLQECPAHAILLNAAAPDDVWPLVEGLKQQVPDMPIVGCSVSPRAARALQSGVLGHLVKPVARADLAEAIRAVGAPVKRVLIVDDDPEVRDMFGRMLFLCDEQLEVGAAADVAEALRELRTRPPDLMLLDDAMPGADAWQMLEAMQREGQIGDVPTFLVSVQDPVEQPLTSRLMAVTVGDGISLDRLLTCSLEMSQLLVPAGVAPGRALE